MAKNTQAASNTFNGVRLGLVCSQQLQNLAFKVTEMPGLLEQGGRPRQDLIYVIKAAV